MKKLTKFLSETEITTNTNDSIQDFIIHKDEVSIREDFVELSMMDLDTISHYTNITSQTIGDFVRTNNINTKKIISVLKDGSLKKRIEIALMILSDDIKDHKQNLMKKFKRKKLVSEDLVDMTMMDIQTISNYTNLTRGIIKDFAKTNNVDTKKLISILKTRNVKKILDVSTMILTDDIRNFKNIIKSNFISKNLVAESVELPKNLKEDSIKVTEFLNSYNNTNSNFFCYGSNGKTVLVIENELDKYSSLEKLCEFSDINNIILSLGYTKKLGMVENRLMFEKSSTNNISESVVRFPKMINESILMFSKLLSKNSDLNRNSIQSEEYLKEYDIMYSNKVNSKEYKERQQEETMLYVANPSKRNNSNDSNIGFAIVDRSIVIDG